jgi:4-hydroxy-4-methyl-2-oxoglutarate aldolase
VTSSSPPSAPTPEQSAHLARLGAATLGESGGRAMRSRLHRVWPGAAVVGPAVPVRCTPGDNLAIHVATATAPAGSVLVVAIEGQPELGHWGEVLTTQAQARGIAGLVIDGGVRDVAALEARRFPVFATELALRGAQKESAGSVGEPVEVGDVRVEAGDVIVADGDGVTVVPGAQLAEVLAAGGAREAKEAAMFVQLEAGATTLELLGLDASPVRVVP